MDHFKPSRWFLNYMKSCLKQNDVNLYGAVRVLATMPSSEVSDILPRSTDERTRTGILAETIGLHNIEIASPAEEERSHQWRGWDDLNKIRERVAERAAANNIITPPTREFPPLEVVPHVPYPTSRVERPYQPRVLAKMHKKKLMEIAEADKLGLDSCNDTTDPKAKAIIRKRALAWSKLARDNAASYFRQQLADVILEQDQVGWTFARAAADPKESVESLKALEDRMVSLKSSYATLKSSIHHIMFEKHQHTIDDARLGRLANHFVDAGLRHDQRPFEPLYIHPDETYPREDGRAVLYFEPDSNPPVLKKTFDLPSTMVQLVLDRYFAMLAVVGSRGTMPVAEFLTTLFPTESINSHVRDIPSLANFAERRLKPGCGPMPLPEGSTSDPAFTYQDNVDYDLSGVRLRTLSAATLLDIAIKYEKLPEKLDIVSLNRALGGTMTQAQIGEEILNMRLR
jgi:transcription factor 1